MGDFTTLTTEAIPIDGTDGCKTIDFNIESDVVSFIVFLETSKTDDDVRFWIKNPDGAQAPDIDNYSIQESLISDTGCAMELQQYQPLSTKKRLGSLIYPVRQKQVIVAGKWTFEMEYYSLDASYTLRISKRHLKTGIHDSPRLVASRYNLDLVVYGSESLNSEWWRMRKAGIEALMLRAAGFDAIHWMEIPYSGSKPISGNVDADPTMASIMEFNSNELLGAYVPVYIWGSLDLGGTAAKGMSFIGGPVGFRSAYSYVLVSDDAEYHINGNEEWFEICFCHEVCHYLGLTHSPDPSSIMAAKPTMASKTLGNVQKYLLKQHPCIPIINPSPC